MRVVRRAMRKGLHQRHFRQGHDALRDFHRQLRGFLQRSAFGQRIRADQLGLVVRGDPVAPHQMIEPEGREKRQHADHHDGAAVRQRPVEHFQIKLINGMQESFGMDFPLAATQL